MQASGSMLSYLVLTVTDFIATVRLDWAFAEDPRKTYRIVCHVLDKCPYDMILGNDFLRMTETMSKYKHRLTSCSFNVASYIPHFGFLGGSRQRLHGQLAGKHVYAIPDSGADMNVMSLQYAVSNGLHITHSYGDQGYLQFADGTYNEIYGQVETEWTFDSGETVPLTFMVLEHCCSDVVLGEEVLKEQDIFTVHAASICDIDEDADVHELAPFDYFGPLGRIYAKLIAGMKSRSPKGSSICRLAKNL